MSNATVSNLGQINASGSTTALFLKIFAGEIITTFDETNVMMDKHMVRTISHGQSAQFPVTGTITASYHTAGTELTGTQISHNERTITIDDLLVADVFIARIDEAKNHYEVRGEYSHQCGHVLANTMDKNCFAVGINGARASATISGGNGGTELTSAAFVTSGSTLASGVFDAAEAFDEKDIPENDRYLALKPSEYYLLAETTDVINRDWGGKGSYSEGQVLKVAGIHIVKSNHVPSTNITTGPSAYQGNFSTTVGLAWHKSGMGTVKLLDLAIESEYDIRRQGTLIVAKYACGHDFLRPESLIEFKTA
jgi:hypothetical protein